MADTVPSASALSKLGDKIKQKLNSEKTEKSKKDFNKKKPVDKKDKKGSEKKNSNNSQFKKAEKTNEQKSKDISKKDKKKGASVKKEAPAKNESNDVLLREIKNLGGDDADLELVGYESDEGSVVDYSGKSKDDKGLKDDIFKYMDSLGLDGKAENHVVKGDSEKAKPDSKKKQKEDDKNSSKKGKKNDKNSNEVVSAPSSEKVEKPQLPKKSKKSPQEVDTKSQFNTSTSNDISEIMDEIDTLEQTNTIFNAKHTKNELIVSPRSDWYNTEELPELPEQKVDDISDFMVERLYAKAKNLLAKENELFTHESNKSNSQKQFLNQLLTAGTLSDKIGAYSLLIQESPLHSVKYLTSLLALCKKKSRGSALQSIAALKDIFVQGGVLPNRKLRWFKNQPGLSTFSSPEWLIVWAFEDWLKQYFFSLIQILEVCILILIQKSNFANIYIRFFLMTLFLTFDRVLLCTSLIFLRQSQNKKLIFYD